MDLPIYDQFCSGMPIAADETAQFALRPGDTVGDYVLEGLIGSGGMGSVYRALQPIIGRRVAIKVLKPSWASRSDTVARFVREARSIHRIKHRGVPDVFTFGTLPNGLHYYVMELLEGEVLRARIARLGRLSPSVVLAIVREIASILDVAHQAGIIHRDLKPENVFLAFEPGQPERFEVKLLDFGIAKLAADKPEQLDGLVTNSHAILGTPVYMSPEQCLGRPVDGRSDIYGLGVLAYEMLAGRPPFPTKGDQIFERKLSGVVPLLSQSFGDLHAFDLPIAQALAREPEDRPPTASDFAMQLDLSVTGARVRAYSAGRKVVGLAALSTAILLGVAYYALAQRAEALPKPPPAIAAPAVIEVEAAAPVLAPEPKPPPEPAVAKPVVRAPKQKKRAPPPEPEPEAPPPPQSDVVPDMPVRW